MNTYEKGFTLLETMVALMILSTLLLIPYPTFKQSLTSHYEHEQIAQQLKDDILLAQHIAMSTGRQVFFFIENREKRYTIRFNVTEPYIQREYRHDEMLIELTTLDSFTLSFLANGHPSKSGSFLLHVGEEKYRFTIYLGKGMVRYFKL